MPCGGTNLESGNMSKKYLKIINGNIITPYRMIRNGQLLISDGKIETVSEGEIAISGAEVMDVEGDYISPGFIDIHVHGGGGSDFMDNDINAFLKVAETHVRFGTTAMLPTTLTSTKAEIIRLLDTYERAAVKNTKGARFLGVHIEGPYFAMDQRGAQDPRYIRDPDP